VTPSPLELSQRDEAFPAGLALLLGGGLLAELLTTPDPSRLAWGVSVLGGLILSVRLAVGIARMFGVIGGEAAAGYRERRE